MAPGRCPAPAKARIQPQPHRFCGMGRAQLVHHVGAVDFHRARADFQFAGDGLVGTAFRKPFQHFAFAPGQGTDPAAGFDQPAARFGMAAGIRLDMAIMRNSSASVSGSCR